MALDGKQTIRGGLNRMSANGPGLGM